MGATFIPRRAIFFADALEPALQSPHVISTRPGGGKKLYFCLEIALHKLHRSTVYPLVQDWVEEGGGRRGRGRVSRTRFAVSSTLRANPSMCITDCLIAAVVLPAPGGASGA